MHCWTTGGSESVERDHHEESRGAGHPKGKTYHSQLPEHVLFPGATTQVFGNKELEGFFLPSYSPKKKCQADSEEPQKVKGEEIERESEEKMPLGEFVDFIQLQIWLSRKKPILIVFFKNTKPPAGALMSSAAGAEESDSNSSDDNDDNNSDDDINVIGVDGDDDINIIVVDSDDDGGGGDEPVGGGEGVPVYRNTYDNSYLVQELDLVHIVAAIGQQVMLLLANHHLDGINDPNDGFEIDFITKNGRLSRQQLEAFPWPQVVQMLVKIVAFDRFLPRMVGVCRFTPDSIHHFVDEVDLRTCDDVSDLEDQARDMLNLHTLNGYPDPPEYMLVYVCDVPWFPGKVFKTKD